MKPFFFVAIATLGLGFAAAQCPPEELIQPCTCEDQFLPIVECGNITEMETLVDVFQRSGDRKFHSFALFNSSIMYLPSASITTKGFNILIVANSSMSALFDALPDDGNEILTITLYNVTFQRGVGWELFGPMKKLAFIKAENTEIRSLGKTFTDNINRDIKFIVLNKTKTKKIQYNAFAQLTKLSNLEIVNSGIKSLKRSMFANPSALVKVEFSGNQIETLPDDIFTNMPQLKRVYLTDNKLTTVSQAVFGEVFDRSGIVHLTGNPLICDCKMLWFVTKETRRISGHCVGPQDQKGKNIPDLKKKDLDYC